jgi:AcrR family transcriptional regulator
MEVAVPGSTKTSSLQTPPEAAPERAMRADARRNHDTLLAAAAGVFAERGADASLEEVARQAGVGIGTLYRHFPNRDALVEAAYRRELELVCDRAAELLISSPPDVALATWMQSFADYIATKKGMASTLKSFLGADNELFSYSRQRIHEAINSLLQAAVAAGSIRADVDGDDLLRAMSGICMTTDGADWQHRTSRLIGPLVDGLRYRAPLPV